MFIHKTLLVVALFASVGGAYAVAQDKGSSPKVAPMSQEDAKITKCEVHGTDLKVEDVRLSYGRPFVIEDYFEAQEKLFPHSKLKVLAGCIVSPDSPRYQTVKFCPDCREAEHQWLEAHKPAPAKP